MSVELASKIIVLFSKFFQLCTHVVSHLDHFFFRRQQTQVLVYLINRCLLRFLLDCLLQLYDSLLADFVILRQDE